MTDDIRDKSHISHNDIIELNFIKKPGIYKFRKYYKQGLRSQIMEVLDPFDVQKQKNGEIIDGIRQFPWAKPLKMLRIFRTKFQTLEKAFEEITKYRVIENYLPEDSYAKSCEFIVDYFYKGKRNVILCGLQDYVDGEVLDPWSLVRQAYFEEIAGCAKTKRNHCDKMTAGNFIREVQKKTSIFIDGLKQMILEAKYVPDLAGIGNLILTSKGNIMLVDINNISKVSFGKAVNLDDKGYPISDKSIEAISLLEQTVLGRTIDKTESIYQVFLSSQRIKRVKELEERFRLSIESKQ